MAFTAATMSFARSAAVLSGGAGVAPSSSLSPSSVFQLRRPAGSLVGRVRCQAENSEDEPATGLPVSPPPVPKASPPPPPTTKKVTMSSTKFSDVLAFGGPAPERINGRLAMVGFVAALGVELVRGDGLAAQVAGGDGLAWFLATASALSVASLVPLFKGVTAESRSGGVMTSDAELWNGRFAMLGLVGLAFTEYVKGGPLV